jgi:hypothetical protein
MSEEIITGDGYRKIEAERDELRAEVARLNGAVSLAVWAHTCANHTDSDRKAVTEHCPVCLRAEVARLKADKARLYSAFEDSIESAKEKAIKLDRQNQAFGHGAMEIIRLIRAAMKGEK